MRPALPLLFAAAVLSQGCRKGENPPDAEVPDRDSLEAVDTTRMEFLRYDLKRMEREARAAYFAKDYARAASRYLAWLNRDAGNPDACYSLAGCYGQMGNAPLAARFLKHAYGLGYRDLAHMRKNPDFLKVKGLAAFDTVVENLVSADSLARSAWGARLFVPGPGLWECRLRLPKDFDSTRGYPVLIGLHGFGSNAEKFLALWDTFQKRDFVYVVPEAPYLSHKDRDPGFSWTLPVSEDSGLRDEARAMTEEFIVNVARAAGAKFHTDRVFLLGFSQGSKLAYHVGLRHPELFSGIIAFGGRLEQGRLSARILARAKGMKCFIAHGRDDRMVDWQEGENARKFLKSRGCEVLFQEFDGGHKVEENAMNQALAWMNVL